VTSIPLSVGARLGAAAVAGAVLAMTVTAGPAAAPAGAAIQGFWPTDFHAFTTHRDFAAGHADRAVLPVRQGDGAITLARGATAGTWTSPEYRPRAGFTELVASWQASTPAGSWVEIGMQARTATATSAWYVMGVWAFEDSAALTRHSVDGQDDPVGAIYTDTFLAHDAAPGGTPVAYRLRVTLHASGAARPVLRQVAATASLPGTLPTTTSPTTMRRQVDLPVPAYSQETHHDEYPAFDGGGEAWCSPTSTSMVLSYYRTGPGAADVAGLPADPVFDANGRADGVVDYGAIHVYDAVYEGAGNWPFNSAYASAYGLDGSIRQYSSLQPLEGWVRRGVPLVVSIRWNNGDADPLNDLDGASITSTSGHLMVVRGFTATGDVIANDPASPGNPAVRHVYRRDQFERDWLRASDGTTYVIKPYWVAG
jgi:hypothetical protein